MNENSSSSSRKYLLEFCTPLLTLAGIYILMAMPVSALPPAERVIGPKKSERASNEFRETAVKDPPIKLAPLKGVPVEELPLPSAVVKGPIVEETPIQAAPAKSVAAEKVAVTQQEFLPGQPLARTGDEIVVCGQFIHTGTPVVLWLDPGGYDAYRVDLRFGKAEESDWKKAFELNAKLTPNRYNARLGLLSPEEIERVRGGGWDLALLQQKVDQFVLHYDVSGISRNCFRTLHDVRCLSVHFMLDIDGTIYQTLDLKERAWHATTSNTRSVGIEIANVGAYAPGNNAMFERWFKKDANGLMRIVIPDGSDGGVRTANFVGHPDRNDPVQGMVQGRTYRQYDFTPQQYAALFKLTATLCKVFPKIKCEYPRDEKGELIPHVLAEEQLKNSQGILGHYHVQKDKQDPGPALQWDRLLDEAKKLMQR